MASPRPSARVDALITDLDGTFWSTDMSIHDASRAAVDAVDDAGVPFVIATGRRAQSALNGLRPAGFATRPGILMNGAVAREQLDGESFLVQGIDPPSARRVLDVFRTNNLEPVIYLDHTEFDMAVGPNSDASSAYLSNTVGYRHVDSLEAEIDERVVIGFGAFGFEYDLLSPIADELNSKAIATAVIGRSLYEGNHGVMVQAAAVDKQTGIDAWCERTGIDSTRLAVVGDGNNDIEMLSNAAIAIVPSDAAPEILDLADVVIQPNEEGGWEQIPEILGL